MRLVRPFASFLAGPLHKRHTGMSAVKRTTRPWVIPPSPGGLIADARSARLASGSVAARMTALPWSSAGIESGGSSAGGGAGATLASGVHDAVNKKTTTPTGTRQSFIDHPFVSSYL